MVNVDIGSAIFLRFLFVLFVNFGMKCSQRRNKSIQPGLQDATGPGCMEVQTAVRRNLICGVQGDRACISISRRHSCSRKHTPCHFLASQDCGKDLRVRAVRLIIDGCESGFAGGQKLRPAWQWEGCVMCVRGGEGRAFN